MLKKLLLSVLPFLWMLTGCKNSRTDPANMIIASVDGTSLYLSQALEEIPPFVFEEDSAHAIQRYAQQWIRRQVSIQHAEDVGVNKTDAFREKSDRFYHQLLEAQLKEYILNANKEQLQVTPDEAQNYYLANKDRFILDETYLQFRHLTTKTRTEADNANHELAGGVTWEEVVQKYSVNPELQLRRSSMYWPASLALSDIPVLNEYLRIMGITERSPIHFHEGEYHFVQLTDIKSEGEAPELDWLIPQIQEWMVLEKSRRITNAYIRNLYLQAEANNEIELADVNDLQTILSENSKNQ